VKEGTYFVGLVKGTGSAAVWHNGHRKTTVVVELRRHVDFLSTDLWKYYGERITTKLELWKKRNELLSAINEEFGTSFEHIIID